MTTVLALDATSSACSAAVWRCAGDDLTTAQLFGRYEIAPRAHTHKLMPMVRDVLAEAELTLADVDVVAYGRGPGAFTGIRIAAGMAQGLALGLDLPMVAVSSLEALALGAALQQGGAQAQPVAALGTLDARMGEVYVGGYLVDLAQPMRPQMVALIDEQVCAPEAILCSAVLPERIVAAGAGLAFSERYPQPLAQAITAANIDAEPDAACIARLAAGAYLAGKAVAPELAQPVYLRDNVATRSTRKPLD